MKFIHFLKSLQSDNYASGLRYLSFIFLGVIIFGAGIFVGNRTTEFSYQWRANYAREFNSPRSPFFEDTNDRSPLPHGAVGSVIGLNFPSFAIKGPHEAEKIILIGTSTLIRSLHADASTTDIHVGSVVMVLGDPDSYGKINATFIRVMPPPPDMPFGTSSTRR